jgi:prepilin-type N-terminal cleavage/methylation domain-containing protein
VRTRSRDGGFTLVELLIVIVVLGILSGIVVFGVARFRTDAVAAGCAADVVTVTRAATAYDAATGRWPADIGTLVDARYLKSVPAGTYRFDTAAKTVSRDPACPVTGTPSATATAPAAGAITGIGGKCVDVAGSSSADGATVQLLSCGTGAGQRWTVPASWPGPITTLGKCLAVVGAGTANGSRTQLSTCNGSANQQWNLGSAGLVTHPQSGRCLDAANGSSADGTRLIIWDCHGQANQLWVLP